MSRPNRYHVQCGRGIINRYGFNSQGVDAVSQRLAAYRQQHPAGPAALQIPRGLIGVNLGKNKSSEDAAADYSIGVSKLGQFADYLVINISSPNTPGNATVMLHSSVLCPCMFATGRYLMCQGTGLTHALHFWSKGISACLSSWATLSAPVLSSVYCNFQWIHSIHAPQPAYLLCTEGAIYKAPTMSVVAVYLSVPAICSHDHRFCYLQQQSTRVPTCYNYRFQSH